MERHWASHCTGNSFCGVNYDEYLLKIEQKSISGYIYDNEYALHRYQLWEQNAIKKVKRAREIGKKIRACTIIQRKFIEYYYHLYRNLHFLKMSRRDLHDVVLITM